MSLQCEPFAVADLLADVEPVLQDRARNERVALFIDRNGLDDLVMDGDMRQWRQVLLNLGMNAIEACMERFPQTGAVRTRAQTPLGQVTLSAERRGARVALAVRDNGCGIAPADRPRLFDPFFTKKHGGTGLGLSLCHKIVTAHGGEIGIESIRGEGSRFLILAPGERVDAKSAAA
jgi:signal transduction histidine kinase